MLSTQECTDILGEPRVNEIIKKFKAKGINQDTTYRVLDYLACNKKVFPFLDNKVLEDRLVNNIETSIIYEGMIQHGISEFKRSKNPISAIRALAVREGYATSSSVVIKKWPTKFLGQRKFLERRLDSVIRHEFDHIATTQFLLQKETITRINKNITDGCRIFNKSEKRNKKEIIQKYIDGNCGMAVHGICGSINNAEHFGSSVLDEGITAYKIKKLDRFANSESKAPQSGYRLREKIAKHMAKTIGEEELLTRHFNNDFAGITQRYMDTAGKDGKYMEDFYRNLDIETGQEKVPAHVALLRKAQKHLGIYISKNNAALQDIREISQATSLSL